MVDGFNHAYGYDFVYRNDHHGDSVAPLGGKGMQAMPFATPQQGLSTVIYDELDLKIETFSVNHYPITPAVGYLFTYKGRTALISGDTTKIASVEKFAVNVDLLVHEALAAHLLKAMNEGASAAGNLPRAKIFLDVLNYHATPVEVAEIARDSKARHLLYYHCAAIRCPALKRHGYRVLMQFFKTIHWVVMVPIFFYPVGLMRLFRFNLHYK